MQSIVLDSSLVKVFQLIIIIRIVYHDDIIVF